MKATDEEYVDKIRNLLKELHSTVVSAKEAGLTVELKLFSLGKQDWAGYYDAAQISRQY